VEGDRRTVADLGPVRYLATLLGADDEDVLGWLILAGVLLLDPAAVPLAACRYVGVSSMTKNVISLITVEGLSVPMPGIGRTGQRRIGMPGPDLFAVELCRDSGEVKKHIIAEQGRCSPTVGERAISVAARMLL
jgi:hypothetical protein